MKRLLTLGVLLFALCAFPASAILDTNENGLSDLWEKANNGGNLLPTGFDPQDDADADGWTNEQEAAAGTSPFDANAPDGIVRPQTNHIPEVLGVSPEVIQVTWPQIPGKVYTLLFSPDLIDWHPVGEAFIGSEIEQVYNFPLTQIEGQPPPPDKLFWRVSIEDVDSDSDGLTDAEEYLFGTDPGTPETLAGYPDLWLATHFSSDLMNGGPSTIDPDGDPDNDGLTNAQEKVLGTNPTVSDNPGIVQNSIRNGDFSIPSIDGTEENPGCNPHQKDTEPNWNYWEGLPEPFGQRSWLASTEPGCPNIEYQRLTGSTDQYVELRAHPAGNRGIKQKVGTIIGKTYLLLFDCKTRPLTEPSINNFSVTIGNENKVLIRAFGFESLTDWVTKSISFTANNTITEIAFAVPQNAPNDTLGCFVDNVRLAPVAIDDDAYATGVDNVSITGLRDKYGPIKGCQDDYWIMAPAGNDGEGSAVNLMKFKIPLNPSVSLAITCPHAEIAPTTVTLAPTDPSASWHGTGNETGFATDNTPVFTVESNQVNLPIRVKTMKQRTVKVALHKVFGLDADDNQTEPQYIPSYEDLATTLNMVYGKQVNTFFEVLPFDEKGTENNGIRFDINRDGNIIVDQANAERSAAVPNPKSTGETPTANIDVWVVGGVILNFTDPIIGLSVAFGINYQGTNIIVDGSLNSASMADKTDAQKKDIILFIIAHEICHVMMPSGMEAHADFPKAFSYLGPNHPSIANRLMSSGSINATLSKRLLIKKEWDAIENWLSFHVDPQP